MRIVCVTWKNFFEESSLFCPPTPLTLRECRSRLYAAVLWIRSRAADKLSQWRLTCRWAEAVQLVPPFFTPVGTTP